MGQDGEAMTAPGAKGKGRKLPEGGKMGARELIHNVGLVSCIGGEHTQACNDATCKVVHVFRLIENCGFNKGYERGRKDERERCVDICQAFYLVHGVSERIARAIKAQP